MIRFILGRLLSGFAVWLLLLLVSLWMIRMIPGSYDELMRSSENNSQENSSIQIMHKPLFYFSIIPKNDHSNELKSILPIFNWNGIGNEYHQTLTTYLSFHFGKSLIDGIDVQNKFLTALPWSLNIQIPAIILIIFLSIWIAFRRIQYPASLPLKIIDNSLIWIHSIPGFWLATMLLLLFANPDTLHWFPSGMQAVSSNKPLTIWFNDPLYLVLPLLCLVLPALAYLVRLIKNGLENSLQKLFWKRALSSGLRFNQALYKEALPVALIPLTAWFAGIFPALISGSLIIEQIYSIPGLGRLMYLSISMRDWPVVQFLFMFGSAMTIIGFIFSDVLLQFVDPRIRESK